MSRIMKMVPALVLAAFSAQPWARAADDKPKDTTPAEQLSEKLDKLNRAVEKFNDLPERLNRIEKSLNALDALQRDVNGLRRELDQTGKILDVLIPNSTRTQDEVLRLRKQTEDLQARIQQLEAQQGKMQDAVTRISATTDGTNERLTDLAKKVAGGTRVSAAPALLPEGTTGTVKIQNTWNQPITAVVNGRSYRDIQPGESRIVDALPLGPITYEVLGVRGPVTTPLRAGEILTVRVFPIP